MQLVQHSKNTFVQIQFNFILSIKQTFTKNLNCNCFQKLFLFESINLVLNEIFMEPTYVKRKNICTQINTTLFNICTVLGRGPAE